MAGAQLVEAQDHFQFLARCGEVPSRPEAWRARGQNAPAGFGANCAAYCGDLHAGDGDCKALQNAYAFLLAVAARPKITLRIRTGIPSFNRGARLFPATAGQSGPGSEIVCRHRKCLGEPCSQRTSACSQNPRIPENL